MIAAPTALSVAGMPIDTSSSASAATAPVRPFDPLSGGDVAFAGGKGANLGRLAGAGFPVPAGFVVGATAYGAFCDGGGLRDRIAARLEHVDAARRRRAPAAARRSTPR
jgi:pyruvate,water dikinase